uniref:Putative secreted protein n=1 Tax=Anopheles marajoara TaxID=58244 RepID=A0A2M4CDL9_9DIPT
MSSVTSVPLLGQSFLTQVASGICPERYRSRVLITLSLSASLDAGEDAGGKDEDEDDDDEIDEDNFTDEGFGIR